MLSVCYHGYHTGIVPSLAHIWREEGIIGYFKGNGTNVVRIVPYVAVQFAAYEEFKKVGMVKYTVLALLCALLFVSY